MAPDQAPENKLLTILRLAHLNAWDWNLKSKALTMTNTADRESLGRISPLMAAGTATVPNYPQILIDRGIICGGAVEMVNEYEMLIYHTPDGGEVAFRLPFTNVDGKNVWLEFRGVVYRDENGLPDRAVGYYSDISSRLDSAESGEFESILNAETEKRRYLNIIKGLTLEYANVFLINLDDESYSAFRLNEISNALIRRELETRVSFRDVVGFYIQKFVVEEDRERLQCLCSPEMIRLMLREKGYFSLNYRSYRDGELVYCQARMALGNVSDSEVVLAFRNIDEEYRLRQSLERESRQDFLTGLLNRRAFSNDILTELCSGTIRNAAFLFLDLDNFKDVNDTLGHAMGDHAIAETAKKLRLIFRRSDIIGRFGGDEFCVFLRDIPMDILKERLELCLRRLRDSYTQHGKTVGISVSIGAAYYTEYKKSDHKWMMEQADMALYEAKDAGRDRYVIREYGTE